MRTGFLLLLLAATLGAQEGPAYVTKLDVTASVGHVILTWKDADGYPGAKYEIWRSATELVRDSLPSAEQLGTVASGIMTFDDATSKAPSYYLVLLKDADGTRRSFYIPGRNKTSTAVAPGSLNPKATAMITNLNVTLSGKTLQVAFRALPAERKLNIYRTTVPVKSLADLKLATLLGQTTGAKPLWVDTPPPGLDFYYTVLDAVAFTEGAPDVLGPQNTTEFPAGFPLVKVATPDESTTPLSEDLRPMIDASLRPLPLPRLSLVNDPVTGQALAMPTLATAPAASLSESTEKVLSAWTRVTKPFKPFPVALVLADEKSATATGSQKMLNQIIASYFLQKDWKTTVEQLSLLLKLELSAELESRVHFYLGQALAAQKSYRLAFLEILSVRNDYRFETTPMLDSLFTLLPSVQD
jgi:hypothetical protein